MRSIVLLVTVIALAISPVKADDIAVAKARAKAALDLMQRQRERDEVKVAKTVAAFELRKLAKDRTEHAGCGCSLGDACTCDACECKYRECTEDLAAALDRAKKLGKPIFVWVGFECTSEPTIRKAFPDAVHAHAASLNGDGTQRIVAGPVGATLRFERKQFGPGTVGEIRAKIATPAKEVSQPATYFTDPFSASSQRTARLDAKR